ncbi:MAG: serpin family protein [Bacteroidales bacterium]|nr:serpin family protein [Bacteroidales bacterium]
MIRKIMLCAASMAAACGLLSCGQADVPPTEGSKTGFALSFFKEVNKLSKSGENVTVSPYSAGAALSMLTEGALGQTKVELDNALNGCLFTDQNLESGDSVVVKSANSVWIDSDFSVRNHYVNTLQKNYDALVETLRFSDPATVQAINNWCSENTNGKIDKMVDKLTPGDVMVLLNALYFNAPWENEFDPALTAKADFRGVSGTSDVQMMYRKDFYNYAEYQGCQMIELPYLQSSYSMFVILPPEGMNIDDFLPYLNDKVYAEAMTLFAPVEVKFRMPKLKLETEMLLNDALMGMGVRTAFTGAADFKGISEMGPLVLSQVKQKCYIDIAESGTEAAAVTSVMVRLTSVRPQVDVKTMTVDRPYVFFIADKDTDNILFAGKIVNL